MDKKQLMRVYFILCILASGVTAYLTLVMVQNKGQIYYFGFVAVIVFGVLALTFRGKMKFYGVQEYIHKNWGQKLERKRNFKIIKSLFTYIKSSGDDFYIDDQTWEDLNMDEVFQQVDRTLTSPGEQYLYHMLRNPLFEEEKIKRRADLIQYFQDSAWIRTKIQVELSRLDRQGKSDMAALLWGELPKKSSLNILVNTLFILTLSSIVSIYFLGLGRAVPMLVGMFMVNTMFHYKVQAGIESRATLVRYLGAIIKTSKNISAVLGDELNDYKKVLKETSESCYKIYRKTSNIGNIKGLDVFGDYISIIFLIEERSYYKVANEIRLNIEELRKMYLALGELDALISAASYRTGLGSYTEPIFDFDKTEISAVNIVHPLLSEAVPNSLVIKDGGIVITGSNMSGKSTFLRTLGINALFAQTIATCLGESYRACFFKVLTSISPNDNILGGKSYYLGEAEALLRIIKSCEEKTAILCIVDEIFRGTNPVERVNAAAEILSYLAMHNALTVVATHDLELTEMVAEEYECYYFSEDVGEDGLKFDYHIKKGVSPTRNAIKLLAYLGYPEVIIENTNNRIAAIEMEQYEVQDEISPI